MSTVNLLRVTHQGAIGRLRFAVGYLSDVDYIRAHYPYDAYKEDEPTPYDDFVLQHSCFYGNDPILLISVNHMEHASETTVNSEIQYAELKALLPDLKAALAEELTLAFEQEDTHSNAITCLYYRKKENEDD